MFPKIRIALKYIHYFFTASNGKGHGIHSHFVFNLVKQVFNDDRKYYAFQKIEKLRKQLKEDESQIFVEDFGAGSLFSSGKKRSVSSIANSAAKPAKFGQLFFRMVNYFDSKNILELGTSLGISTAYFASAKTDVQVTSLEGSESIAEKAADNFVKLDLQNIRIVKGNFDETLQEVLDKNEPFDMIFFDGNHRKEPTLNYFNQCLKNSHDDAVFIFDDIHWSPEMEETWSAIKSHPSVTCSIDLFFVGFIFFRKEFKETQHLRIRF
jgi:predicted O-methyltransferase YrrM